MAGVVFTPRAGVHSEFRKEKKKMTDTKKNKKISSSTLSRRESECGSEVFSSRYFVNGDTHMRGERGSNDPEAFSTHCTDNGTKDKPGKKNIQWKKKKEAKQRHAGKQDETRFKPTPSRNRKQGLQEEKKKSFFTILSFFSLCSDETGCKTAVGEPSSFFAHFDHAGL